MKQVNNLLTTKPLISKTQAGPTKLENAEVEIVNYVYARLKTIFGGKYKTTFPTEKAEKGSKMEWARDINNFNLEELERGLTALKASDIDWPDVKSFLSLCKPARVEPMHREFQLPKPKNIDRENGHKQAASLLDLMKEKG